MKALWNLDDATFGKVVKLHLCQCRVLTGIFEYIFFLVNLFWPGVLVKYLFPIHATMVTDIDDTGSLWTYLREFETNCQQSWYGNNVNKMSDISFRLQCANWKQLHITKLIKIISKHDINTNNTIYRLHDLSYSSGDMSKRHNAESLYMYFCVHALLLAVP